MQPIDPSLWGLFISAFISSTIAPGGSEAVLVFMLSKGYHSNEGLLFAATTGNTLGAMTTWCLGRFAAKKYPLASLLSVEKQKGLMIVKKRGHWVLLFSWLPIVGDVFCFVGGWLKLPLFSSFSLILIGKFFRYLAVISLYNLAKIGW